MSLAAFVKEGFTKIVEDTSDAALDQIPLYVSPEFVHCVDGKTHSYDQFVAHIKLQHQMIQSAKIEYTDMFEHGDQVAGVSFTHMVKNDGSKVSLKMIGVIKVVNGKVTRVDEVTQLVTGDKATDTDLGSRAK